MLEKDVKIAKYDVITRLLYLMDNISEDQQFALFKQLFKESVANHLVKRIIDMSDNQRLILMKHLQEIASETGNKDKRKTPRKDCLINANMRIQGPRFNSYILDIGIGGVFIEADTRFPVGTELLLKFSLPNHPQPILFAGKIVWSTARGFGVNFDKVSVQQSDMLESFVEEKK